MQDETLSDHKLISWEIINITKKLVKEKPTERDNNWNLKRFNEEHFIEHIKTWKYNGLHTCDIHEISKWIKKACEKIMGRKKKSKVKRQVYWWSEEIKKVRETCIKKRRVAQRLNKHKIRNEAEAAQASDEYKACKKELKLMILRAKAQKWKEVCQAVEDDVWGLGYKIVRKKLGIPLPIVSDEEKQVVIENLFPRREYRNREFKTPEIIEKVTREEVQEAGKKLRNKKAPGPDGVPPEAIKAVVKEVPELLASSFTALLEKGQFPGALKQARLVLIPKPKKNPEDKNTYRPLCLLNSISKLFEHIIKARILRTLIGPKKIAISQYGFCKGKSAAQAIRKVVNMATEEMRKTIKKRNLCALITVDIKNAFNTVDWKCIIEELKTRKLSQEIISIVNSYLHERTFLDDDKKVYSMECGVPQGSVLGPLLWNLLYDGLLKMPVSEGVHLIAYADDLAVIIKAKTSEEIMYKGNRVIQKIITWLEGKHLEIAEQKTECSMLVGRKKHGKVTFQVKNLEIFPKNDI